MTKLKIKRRPAYGYVWRFCIGECCPLDSFDPNNWHMKKRVPKYVCKYKPKVRPNNKRP